MGNTTGTAPIRGGIGAKEVRALLKPRGEIQDELTNAATLPYMDQGRAKAAVFKKVRWRPVPLGEVMRKDFESAKLRLRESN